MPGQETLPLGTSAEIVAGANAYPESWAAEVLKAAINLLTTEQVNALAQSLGTGAFAAAFDPSSITLTSLAGGLVPTGTGGVVRETSPSLVTPALGTPTSITLTNATGLPITAGTIGTLGVARGGTNLTALGTALQSLRVNAAGTALEYAAPAGGGDALVADPLSQFAATTSAQLAGVVSDETGTGALVFGTSPTLETPALGTPTALVGTNITGTAAGLTAGNVTTNANLTGVFTSVGNATAIADAALSIAKTSGLQTDLNAKQPTITFGTGSQAALGINLGAAGSVVTYNAALGTPSSGNLTNCTFPTLNQSTTGNAGTVTTINGKIAAGTNVTITGAGTDASPYSIESSDGGGGITNFEEILSTASPNNTVNALSLRVKSSVGTTNVDAVITPKGTGAFILGAAPDGTAVGGNKRGDYAVDLQLDRSSATQVASGLRSIAIGSKASAIDTDSIAIGTNSYVNSNLGGIAIGPSASCGQNAYRSVAIGQNAKAGNTAVAIGMNSTSEGAYRSVTLGYEAVSRHTSDVSFGASTHPTDRFASAFNGINCGAIARTVDDSPTELLWSNLYTGLHTSRFGVSSGAGFTANVVVFGIDSSGVESCRFERVFTVVNSNGTTAMRGALQTVGTDYVGIVGCSLDITANDADDTVLFKLTGQPAFSCTGTAATDTITAIGHDFTNNDLIIFTSLSGGDGLSTNSGLWYNKKYFVRDVSGDTFKLSNSAGGSAIDFTTDITAGTISEPIRWSSRIDYLEISHGV